MHLLFGRWGADGWAVDDRALLVPDGPMWSRGWADDPDMDLVGDLNGDGHPELLIGSNWTGWDSSWYGCAYLFYGPLGRDATFVDVDATICGVHADEGVGVEVEAGGDLDGDGYDDLLVASYRAVYVFPGGPGP